MTETTQAIEAADGRSQLTEVLGCAVDFVDDCKGKWMSHEAHLVKQADASRLNGYGAIEATGYGATKEEALADLRAVVARLIATQRLN